MLVYHLILLYCILAIIKISNEKRSKELAETDYLALLDIRFLLKLNVLGVHLTVKLILDLFIKDTHLSRSQLYQLTS